MTDTRDSATRLADSLEKFETHRIVRVYDNIWLMIWTQFLRGLAFGLGSVLGATILVYVLVQMLAQIEFLPIIGDWAVELIDQIERDR